MKKKYNFYKKQYKTKIINKDEKVIGWRKEKLERLKKKKKKLSKAT